MLYPLTNTDDMLIELEDRFDYQQLEEDMEMAFEEFLESHHRAKDYYEGEENY